MSLISDEYERVHTEWRHFHERPAPGAGKAVHYLQKLIELETFR